MNHVLPMADHLEQHGQHARSTIAAGSRARSVRSMTQDSHVLRQVPLQSNINNPTTSLPYGSLLNFELGLLNDENQGPLKMSTSAPPSTYDLHSTRSEPLLRRQHTARPEDSLKPLGHSAESGSSSEQDFKADEDLADPPCLAGLAQAAHDEGSQFALMLVNSRYAPIFKVISLLTRGEVQTFASEGLTRGLDRWFNVGVMQEARSLAQSYRPSISKDVPSSASSQGRRTTTVEEDPSSLYSAIATPDSILTMSVASHGKRSREDSEEPIEPPTQVPQWESEWFIPLQHTRAFIDNRFNNLQQASCKAICKSWIREIEPRKSLKWPYRGKETNRPPWWPEGVKHCEPDHLKKPDRLLLLFHLLTNQSFPLGLLQSSTRDLAADPMKYCLLHEIYIMAHLLRTQPRGSASINGQVGYICTIQSTTKHLARFAVAQGSPRPISKLPDPSVKLEESTAPHAQVNSRLQEFREFENPNKVARIASDRSTSDAKYSSQAKTEQDDPNGVLSSQYLRNLHRQIGELRSPGRLRERGQENVYDLATLMTGDNFLLHNSRASDSGFDKDRVHGESNPHTQFGTKTHTPPNSIKHIDGGALQAMAPIPHNTYSQPSQAHSSQLHDFDPLRSPPRTHARPRLARADSSNGDAAAVAAAMLLAPSSPVLSTRDTTSRRGSRTDLLHSQMTTFCDPDQLFDQAAVSGLLDADFMRNGAHAIHSSSGYPYL